MRRSQFFVVTFVLGAAGCVGGIGSGGSSEPAGNPGNPSGPGNPSTSPGSMVAGDPNTAGPMPLRRLNHREYNNTIRDLLGDTSRPADGFPPDQESDFTFRRAGLVATVDATRLGGAAETLANAAEARFATLVPCAPAAPAEEEPCARKFIESFGLRAYRRPLEPDEVERHLKLYRDGRGAPQLDHPGSIKLLIEAMLQSPHFVYRWELGSGQKDVQKEGQVVRLGPYQIASRLSYALLGSMPDQALFDAAGGGRLASEADVEREARRLLADPRAKETLITFVEELFGFDQLADRPKDATLYPEWKDDLKAAMTAELRAFVGQAVFDGDAKLDTLLAASFSFVNQPLAAIYGKTGVTGAGMARTDLNPEQRAGLLTLAPWLTLTGASDGSHPVMRGKMIYERLLCGELPPPPPDVPEPRPPADGLTTRQRFAEHGQQACAVGCHAIMDPLGFAFENYDGLGKWRDTDAGRPVDATGSVDLDGGVKNFKNARELTRMLIDSPEARRCFVTQMSRFAWNRHDTQADRFSIDTALTAFDGAGRSIKDLVVAITRSRSFRYRAAAEGEVLR
jgi:hypothetical protein